jgi:hypothetical protein
MQNEKSYTFTTDSFGGVTIRSVRDPRRNVYLQGDDCTELLARLETTCPAYDDDCVAMEYLHLMTVDGCPDL